jgi:hypothetical protein
LNFRNRERENLAQAKPGVTECPGDRAGLSAERRLRVRSGHQQKQAYVGNGQPQVVTLECAAHFDFPLRNLIHYGRGGHSLVDLIHLIGSAAAQEVPAARGTLESLS